MIEVPVPMGINAGRIIQWLRDNAPAQDWYWNADVNGVFLEYEYDATAFKLKFDL